MYCCISSTILSSVYLCFVWILATSKERKFFHFYFLDRFGYNISMEKPARKKYKPTRHNKSSASTIIRHRKVLKILSKNGGKMGAAMLEVGYSPEYAKNPGKLMNTLNFQELLQKNLPESLVTKRHRDLLNAKNVTRTYIKGDIETETESMNVEAVKSGVDMAYKLRGAYAPEKHEVLMMYQDLTDQDLRKQLREIEEELGINRDPGVIIEGETA
jgi:hypothetical protein